eukprot:CAMPEP_0113492136 /NCGR_PEP_ID=MMETSP0014_2-20120614/27916_1 /TAXON_ID=2857 /ORGANISM="Nitzschia sp." /LENGTH=323 /DNA_ID=CAMNT_0000385949 /DNA_START=39 /DNA_END=1007 /DNA_ORIENTATION=- /assembly_acc=CAM_ASM_000159
MSDVVDDILMMPAGEGQHSSEAAAMESCSSSSTSMPVPQQPQPTAAAAQSVASVAAVAPQTHAQQAPNVVSPGVQQQQHHHHQTLGPQIVVHHPLQPQQQQIQPLPAPPMMMLDNIKDVVHVLKRRELTHAGAGAQQQQQQLTAAAAQSIAFASVAAAPQNRSQQAPNVVSPGVQQQQHHQTSGPQIVVHHPLQSQQQQQHPLPAPPTMMLDNIKDVVHVLKRRELTYCNTYSTTANNNNTSFDKWRPVMVSWMWSVIDTFSLMPQLVPTGLYFLDMCSSTSSKILTENGADPATAYPLMAMTALNLAVKVHETKMFPLDQLV